MSEIDAWNRSTREAEWDELQVRFAALQHFLQDDSNTTLHVDLDNAISQLLRLAPYLTVSIMSERSR